MNSQLNHRKCPIDYPKHESFNVGIKKLEDAIHVVNAKRKFGGCFEQVDEGFIVYWLPKNHPQIQEFSW